MARLTLWNGPPSDLNRQQQTYEVGRIDFNGAVKDTDYTIDTITRKHFTVLDDSDVYSIRMTFNESGMPFVELDKTWTPYESTQYIPQEKNGSVFYTPSNCNLDAPLLEYRPTDWEIHWRDKYNTISYEHISGTPTGVYWVRSTPLYSNGELNFTSNTYVASNTARKMFYTMGDNYFTITNGEDKYSVGGVPHGPCEYIGFGFVGWNGITAEESRAYPDVPRVSGITGDYVTADTLPGQLLLQSRLERDIPTSDFDGTSTILPRIFCNFVGFTLTFDYEDTSVYPSTHETITDNFIGVFIWEETVDGIKTRGQMTAISLRYWLARGSKGEWGPGTGVEGGDGLWTHETTGVDDKNGQKMRDYVNDWNEARWDAFSKAGLNIYEISSNDLAEVSRALWDPTIWRNFQYLQQSPLDAIIALHLLPEQFVQREQPNKVRKIVLANHEFDGVWGYLIEPTTVDLSHDTEILNQTGSYQNFAGYATAYLHLPYIGNVSLDVQQLAEGYLSVIYACDILSGDVTAFVYVQDRNGSDMYVGEYKGNCAQKIPLFMRTNDRLSSVQSLINDSKSLVTNVMSLGTQVAGMNSGAIPTPGSGSSALNADTVNTGMDLASNVMNITGDVIKIINPKYTVTGTNINFGSTSPTWNEIWLCLSFPEPSNPEQYQDLIGLPSDISGTINGSDTLDGPFTGFLAVREIKLDNVVATDAEKKEIELLMKSGVYLDSEA